MKCQLPDCNQSTERVYRVNLDGYGLSFHSNDHARVGIDRWMEKKKMGIKPGQPRPKEEPGDIVETGNIPEIGGEEE